MHEFPADPTDGMIYKVRTGLYFVYELATRSWIKVAGDQIFSLATPVADGLMAASDFHKLNRIVVPMPSSTITAEDCTAKFSSGNINMYGTDDYVGITGTPTIQNAGVSADYPFRISKNTAGFDFTIDTEQLIRDLIDAGQINLVGPVGPKGITGDKGPTGLTLPTGPKGRKGPDGESPPCATTVAQDIAPIELNRSINRAIIDLETRQISDNEYVLVAKRGIIGNPDASSSSANIRCDDKSTWLAAVPELTTLKQDVYFIDINPIMTVLREKFASEVQRLKAGHEDVVQNWLEKMSNLFYEQKSVLCCALTRCEQLNAGSGSSSFMATAPQLSVLPSHQSASTLTAPAAAPDGPLTLVVDGIANAGTARQAATIELAPGRYSVQIDDCCIQHGPEYVANVHLVYNGKNGRQDIQFVKPGRYTSLPMARAAYLGLTVEIDHQGGSVSAYLASSLIQQTDGVIRLLFNNIDEALVSAEFSCTASRTKLTEYELAWTAGNCCGLVTRLAGQDYIVVKRSPACGGNESDSFDCVVKFAKNGSFPALAWPTLDGRTFVQLPNERFLFKSDPGLTALVAGNLTSGAYHSLRMPGGDVRNAALTSKTQLALTSQFGVVLFPVL